MSRKTLSEALALNKECAFAAAFLCWLIPGLQYDAAMANILEFVEALDDERMKELGDIFSNWIRGEWTNKSD